MDALSSIPEGGLSPKLGVQDRSTVLLKDKELARDHLTHDRQYS